MREARRLMSREAVLRRLLEEARLYSARLAVSLLLGVVAGLAPLVLAWAIQFVANDVFAPAGANWTVLWWVIALIVVSQTIGNAAGYGQSYLTAWSGQQMIARLRVRLFDRVLHMPLSEFDRWRPGEFIARFSSDLGLMTDAVSISIPQMVQVSVTFVGALAAMIYTDWLLSLVLFACAPLVYMAVARFSKLITTGTNSAQARIADLSANLTEVLQNQRIVKAFGRERFERDRFERSNENYFVANLKVTQFNQTQSPVVATIVTIALVVIVIATVREVAVGRLGRGEVWRFWALAASMINPMNRFAIFVGDFTRALVGAGRIFEVLDAPVEPEDSPSALPLENIKGTIAFESVSFAYEPDEMPVLHDLDAQIEAGEVVALVGPSGGGKSTIVNLVPRFFSPQVGRVTLDGIDLTRVRLSELRAAIAIVPQETLLFNGTIEENIRYGRLDADFAAVESAAHEANADEFIAKLPEGYRTIVGERGIRLSGGQRQRIAIARAIVRDPRILILDEATSALDSHSEDLIEEALDRILPGRTTLIIAHRLSTIRRAKRIFYIEDGCVRESGTHDALLARSGAYARLYARQFSMR